MEVGRGRGHGKNHSARVSCTGHRATEAPRISGVEDAARSVGLWLKSRKDFYPGLWMETPVRGWTSQHYWLVL